MATPVTMPQLGETVVEGTITKWLKQEGESVDRDEPLFEISTDKVDTEVPSPLAGKVVEIKVPEGETVSVGKVRQPVPNTLAIDLKTLPPGAYVIQWRVLSVDTHVTDGVLKFTVGSRR